VLLPVNPDRSAARLRRELKKELGIEIAVIVSDSFGRPWREGLTEVAIASRECGRWSTTADAAIPRLFAAFDGGGGGGRTGLRGGTVCGKLAGTPRASFEGIRIAAETVRRRI